MILYLFKSAIGLLILWGIYRLFLESEKLHVFNRFYLLLSLVLAFAFPLISLELPLGSTENNPIVFQKAVEAQQPLSQLTNQVMPVKVSLKILWIDYFIALSILISLFFLVRFLNNLLSIYRSIKKNPVIKWHSAKLVLLEKSALPYTFLNYIFIDKIQYENACIEPELFSHELAHVRQKHSLDVIFLEFLRIVFWFNPLLWLFKQAIQLNHEFLADEAVNKTYHDVPTYQYLLLSKASQAGGLALTSNLNFQITKKRLLMMTKITPQSTAFFKKAISALLFIVLAFCLADFQLIAQEPTKLKQRPPVVTSAIRSPGLTMEDINYKNGRIMLIGKNGLPVPKKYTELTEEEKNARFKVIYLPKSSPTAEEMNKWKDAKTFGVWINEKRVPNSELSKYKVNDIAHFSSSKLAKNAINYGKHYYQIDLMTNDYYEKVYIKEVKESPLLIIEKEEKKN